MSTHRITVMQVIGNLNIGGAQEVVSTLVGCLPSQDCYSIVCTLRDGVLRQEIEKAGVHVEVLTGRRYNVLHLPMFIVDQIKLGRELKSIIEKHNVDIIQTHLLGSLDFLVMLLPYISPLRSVIWTFHNIKFELNASRLTEHYWTLKPKKLGHRILYRLGSSLVGGFVAVSEQVKQAMIEVIGSIGSKVTVICNGIDTRKYENVVDIELVRSQLGLDLEKYLIVVVATLKEQKGHRYLVEALASVVPQNPQVHAIFIGNGPLRTELESQAKERELDKHIHFLGNRQDVPELLAASDLFVLPSLWEGLPMALLEAMATGLPVIATKVSGTVQVVIPDESGILVPPGDVEELAQSIGFLLHDPKRARSMGQAARQRVVKNFSAQKQAAEHLALYHRLLQ